MYFVQIFINSFFVYSFFFLSIGWRLRLPLKLNVMYVSVSDCLTVCVRVCVRVVQQLQKYMLNINVYNVICNWSTRMRLPLINSKASDTMCLCARARVCIYHFSCLCFVFVCFYFAWQCLLLSLNRVCIWFWCASCICRLCIHPDAEICCGRLTATIKFKPNKILIFSFSPEQINRGETYYAQSREPETAIFDFIRVDF